MTAKRDGGAGILLEVDGKAYRLDKLLRRNGTKEVWLARAKADDALVVIKSTECGDFRVQRSIDSLRQLKSPHIIEILARQVDVNNSRVHVVYRFIDGVDFGQIIGRAKATRAALPLDFVVHLVRGAAVGLAVAHDQGITHRDVTPGNLMLGADGLVVLIDFELAVAPTSERTVRFRNFEPGTPGYQAPEVIASPGRPPEPGIDIYGLGVVMAELLSTPTGPAAHPTVRDAGAAARLLASLRGVPEDLLALVRRMASPHATERPNARQVIAALDASGYRAEPLPVSPRAIVEVLRGEARAPLNLPAGDWQNYLMLVQNLDVELVIPDSRVQEPAPTTTIKVTTVPTPTTESGPNVIRTVATAPEQPSLRSISGYTNAPGRETAALVSPLAPPPFTPPSFAPPPFTSPPFEGPPAAAPPFAGPPLASPQDPSPDHTLTQPYPRPREPAAVRPDSPAPPTRRRNPPFLLLAAFGAAAMLLCGLTPALIAVLFMQTFYPPRAPEVVPPVPKVSIPAAPPSDSPLPTPPPLTPIDTEEAPSPPPPTPTPKRATPAPRILDCDGDEAGFLYPASDTRSCKEAINASDCHDGDNQVSPRSPFELCSTPGDDNCDGDATCKPLALKFVDPQPWDLGGSFDVLLYASPRSEQSIIQKRCGLVGAKVTVGDATLSANVNGRDGRYSVAVNFSGVSKTDIKNLPVAVELKVTCDTDDTDCSRWTLSDRESGGRSRAWSRSGSCKGWKL